MKGKLLENIVLTTGLLVVGAALFLIFFAKTPELTKSINIIFATGFIIYIMYNHIMARNLNGEIYALQKHVDNLKDEIGRLENTLKQRDKTIAEQNSTIASQKQDLADTRKKLADTEKQLADARAEVKRLSKELSKEENP
jgi:septal ring factor EnvC (AmiA/AmiB activator)